MTMDVLPNPLVVVPGHHKVTIVFCISGDCQQWQHLLPVETQKRLEDDNRRPLSTLEEDDMLSGVTKSNLNGFPFIPLGRLYYSSLTTGLMSQLASYQLIKSAKDLTL